MPYPGALVCGRTLLDFTDGWDELHTMPVPVVVVTHQAPTDWVYCVQGDRVTHLVFHGADPV